MGFTSWLGDRGRNIANITDGVNDQWREQVSDPTHRWVFGDNTEETRRLQGGYSSGGITDEFGYKIPYNNPSGSDQFLADIQNGHEADAFSQFLAGITGGGPSGSQPNGSGGGFGGPSGPDPIEVQYNEMLGQLNDRKAASDTRIGTINNDYQTSISGRYADQQKNQNMLQRDITDRFASSLAAQSAMDNEIAGYGRSLGLDTSHLAAQAMANQNTLQQNSNVAADLNTRMSQIAGNSNADWQRSGDLVRQGALDTSQNNWQSANNSLSAQKQQAYAAQAAARSSGSGGGSTKMSAASEKQAILQETIDMAIVSSDPHQALAAMYQANPLMADFLIAQTDFDKDGAKEGFYNQVYGIVQGWGSPQALGYQEDQGNSSSAANTLIGDIRSGRR